jgi:hypothetical protein
MITVLGWIIAGAFFLWLCVIFYWAAGGKHGRGRDQRWP